MCERYNLTTYGTATDRNHRIEAQTSFLEHVPAEKLYEIGLSAVVIIILMAAYYLSVKAEKLEQ